MRFYFLCRVSWLPIITNLGSLSQIRLNEYQLNSISFNYNICGIWKIFNNTRLIVITEDGLQPSILSDCNFNSSAGEVSGTQAGLREGGVSRYIGTGPEEPRKGTWISEGPHWHILIFAEAPKQYWRIYFYYPFLDHLITEREPRLLTTENRSHAQHLPSRAVDQITNDYGLFGVR
jgi:hypothetical protein